MVCDDEGELDRCLAVLSRSESRRAFEAVVPVLAGDLEALAVQSALGHGLAPRRASFAEWTRTLRGARRKAVQTGSDRPAVATERPRGGATQAPIAGGPLVAFSAREDLLLARYWSVATRRPYLHLAEPGDLRRLSRRSPGLELTLLVPPASYTLSGVQRLNRELRRGVATLGLVPTLDRVGAMHQAIKSRLYALAARPDGGRLFYAPTLPPLPGQQVGDDLLYGPSVGTPELRERLASGLGLLAVLTHSNGFDAFLGERLVLCAREGRETAAFRAGDRLLPCFEGAACRFSQMEPLALARLKARVVAFFVCGGVLPEDGNLVGHASFSAQVFRSPYVQALVSSVALFHAYQADLLPAAAAFASSATAGEAVRIIQRLVGTGDPEAAESLVLLGDPGAPVPRLPRRASSGRADPRAAERVGLAHGLPRGRLVQVQLSTRAAACVRAWGRSELVCASGDEAWAMHPQALKGYLSAEEPRSLLLYSPVGTSRPVYLGAAPPARAEASVLRFLEDVLCHGRETEALSRWIAFDGGPTLSGDAGQALQEDALRVRDWIQHRPRDELRGSLALPAIVARLERHLLAVQRGELEFLLAMARDRGTQIQKSWASRLVQRVRLAGDEECPYCGAATQRLRHSAGLAGYPARQTLECPRCWTVADVADPTLPLRIDAPREVVAGTSLSLTLEGSARRSSRLVLTSAFVLEGWTAEGRQVVASDPRATSYERGQRARSPGELQVPIELCGGVCYLSCIFVANGSLNVLRRPVLVCPAERRLDGSPLSGRR